MDPDFPEIPTDYEAGTDFRVQKSTKGQYADYSTSNWARRERSLNQEERDTIEKYGLFNLNDFLPKKPNSEELGVIFDMFEASVDGQLYDVERFGDYYRPYGVDAPGGNRATAPAAAPAPAPAPTPVAAPAPVVEQAPTPVKTYNLVCYQLIHTNHFHRIVPFFQMVVQSGLLFLFHLYTLDSYQPHCLCNHFYLQLRYQTQLLYQQFHH